MVKASIPLPTLGHASGTSTSGSSAARPTSPTPGQSPSAPLSSLFLKTAGAGTSAVKSGATTAVSVGEAEEMGAGAATSVSVSSGTSAGDAGLGLGLGGPTTAGTSASESPTKPTEAGKEKPEPDGKAGKTSVTAEGESAPAVPRVGGDVDRKDAPPQEESSAKDIAPAADGAAAQSPPDIMADKTAERSSEEGTTAPETERDEVERDTPSDTSVNKSDV